MADVDTDSQTTESTDVDATANTVSNNVITDKTGTNVVPRADFDKEVKSLINQRQDLKTQLVKAQELYSAKEKEFISQIEAIKQENETNLMDVNVVHSNELRKRDFVDNVMQDVAPGSREHAKLLLDGYVARGDFDPLNQDKEITTLAQEARDRIAKLHPSIYSNTNLPAVSTSTPGVDWDKFSNWGEIPADMKTQVPDDVFNRLTRTIGSGRKLV